MFLQELFGVILEESEVGCLVEEKSRGMGEVYS